MKNDNYHLGQLNWPVSQIDIQRNMVGFVVEGHILCSAGRLLTSDQHMLSLLSAILHREEFCDS